MPSIFVAVSCKRIPAKSLKGVRKDEKSSCNDRNGNRKYNEDRIIS